MTLADLWVYSVSNAQWTWMGGSKDANTETVYPNSTYPTGILGARYQAASWQDSRGQVWVFGGLGSIAASYNDVWKIAPPYTQWEYMGGNKTTNIAGKYLLGAAYPGSRYSPATWIDSNDNLWMFGGSGYGSTSSKSNLFCSGLTIG